MGSDPVQEEAALPARPPPMAGPGRTPPAQGFLLRGPGEMDGKRRGERWYPSGTFVAVLWPLAGPRHGESSPPARSGSTRTARQLGRHPEPESGGSTSTQTEGDILIGAVLPITGGSAKMGQDMQNSIEMAFEEINAQGGVLGRKLKLEVQDDDVRPADRGGGGQQDRQHERGGGHQRLLQRRLPAHRGHLPQRRDGRRRARGQRGQPDRAGLRGDQPHQRHQPGPGPHGRRLHGEPVGR